MKVRQGFVSNSSSSSFIIAVPKNFDVESHPKFEEIFDEWKWTAIDQYLDYQNKPKSDRDYALLRFRTALYTLKYNFEIWGGSDEEDARNAFHLGLAIRDIVLDLGTTESNAPDESIVVNVLGGDNEEKMRKLLGTT